MNERNISSNQCCCKPLPEPPSDDCPVHSPSPEDEFPEVVAALRGLFAGVPDVKRLGNALVKLAEAALGPEHGVAILSQKECLAIAQDHRRMNQQRRAHETPAESDM